MIFPKKVILISAGAILSVATVFLYFQSSEQTDLSSMSPSGFYTRPDGPRADFAWEVSSPQGEMLVPDIYYADPVQNDQLMPTAVSLSASNRSGQTVPYQIQHLIYPTIGNPNLFIKNDPESTLTVVLRLPQEWLQTLEPKVFERNPRHPRWTLELNEKLLESLGLYLLPREVRPLAEGQVSLVDEESFRIRPSHIELMDETEAPEELRQKGTLVLHFTQQDLLHISAKGSINGLYDLRFEYAPHQELQHWEFQYNAVRIFPEAPINNEYTILNMTDTQTSVSIIKQKLFSGFSFKFLTLDPFLEFVNYVNSSNDPAIIKSAFITFNGDLHNGGSPVSLNAEEVATTYNTEAQAILEIIRTLNYPLFLTPGNHDGYVSMGHAPQFQKGPLQVRKLIEKLAPEKAADFFQFLDQTLSQPGGRHADIFQGQYVRRINSFSPKNWQKITEPSRNRILYDGFYQWRRTYGPLYMSWKFGKNHYINVNSYDLRQHRRSGWGMYTVNYGGGVSPFQMGWLRDELDVADQRDRDAIILAHHDPRGGHNGEDYPYYFRQIDFNGMNESLINFVNGEYLNPILCKMVPSWAQTTQKQLSCLHDGLQEWMRADPEFDCANSDFKKDPDTDGSYRCDQDVMSASSDVKKHPAYSGYQFIHQLAVKSKARTLLLGHTHFNSLEIKYPGEELVPGKVLLDGTSLNKYSAMEAVNPNRVYSRIYDSRGQALSIPQPQKRVYNPEMLQKSGIQEEDKDFLKMYLILAEAGHTFQRKLDAHELAILRLTSVANLTPQIDIKNLWPSMGFSVLKIQKKERSDNYPYPQINEVTFYQKKLSLKASIQNQDTDFIKVGTKSIDREKPANTSTVSRNPRNPLPDFFRFKD